MNTNLLVSVGVPTYNSSKTIVRCLKSILTQDYPNLEIVVYDDASRDNTLETIRTTFQNEPRIRVLPNSQNRGVLFARNEILKYATGDFLMWVDSDDYLLPKAISRLLMVYEKRGVDGTIIVQNAQELNGDSKKTIFPTALRSFDKDEATKCCLLDYSLRSFPWTLLAPKTVYKKIDISGYLSQSKDIVDDYLMGYLYFLNSNGAVRIPEVGYSYCVHQQSDSHSDLFYKRFINTIDEMLPFVHQAFPEIESTLILRKAILQAITISIDYYKTEKWPLTKKRLKNCIIMAKATKIPKKYNKDISRNLKNQKKLLVLSPHIFAVYFHGKYAK
jgi:glycosyltransferase involved in cell wall biosynthesis